jgi:hypothetical protein
MVFERRGNWPRIGLLLLMTGKNKANRRTLFGESGNPHINSKYSVRILCSEDGDAHEMTPNVQSSTARRNNESRRCGFCRDDSVFLDHFTIEK